MGERNGRIHLADWCAGDDWLFCGFLRRCVDGEFGDVGEQREGEDEEGEFEQDGVVALSGGVFLEDAEGGDGTED